MLKVMRPFTIWLLLSLLVVSCSKVDNTGRVPVPGETFRAKLASLNWGTDTTFVYGHKTPDVDAITSSLSYAKLMRTLGYNCKAKASSAINRETSYISKRFGFSIPGVVGGTGDWGIFPAPVPLTTVKFAQHKRNDIFSGSDSCTHDFTIEHRVFMVFKKYWLYQDIYFSDVFPEVSPLLPFVCDFSLSDNHGNVYIAI